MNEWEEETLRLMLRAGIAREERIGDLEALVRWLALPYGNRRPIFTTVDQHGQPLTDNIRLQRAWNLTFTGDPGQPPEGEEPPAPGGWTRCGGFDPLDNYRALNEPVRHGCGTWLVDSNATGLSPLPEPGPVC